MGRQVGVQAMHQRTSPDRVIGLGALIDERCLEPQRLPPPTAQAQLRTKQLPHSHADVRGYPDIDADTALQTPQQTDSEYPKGSQDCSPLER